MDGLISIDSLSWAGFAIALIVFGFAPRFLLRGIVRLLPTRDPRRRELLAELAGVPRLERPFWVMEQLEVAVVEGLLPRVASRCGRASSFAWSHRGIVAGPGLVLGVTLSREMRGRVPLVFFACCAGVAARMGFFAWALVGGHVSAPLAVAGAVIASEVLTIWIGVRVRRRHLSEVGRQMLPRTVVRALEAAA